LFLAVLSPSQTISVITVLCGLYKSRSSSLCHLWNYLLTSSFLYPDTIFSMFPNTWYLCTVWVSDHSLYPNKTIGKNIILFISSSYNMHYIQITKLKL
jgi:hypothetical protein